MKTWGGAAVLVCLTIAGGAGAQEGVIAEQEMASASPVYTIGRDEILRLQQPELERILRLLPLTQTADGQNLNTSTSGAATVDLRGLGAQRTLVLIDGRRLTPFSIAGVVDTSVIPLALIERIEISTGGGSVAYGADAMAGTINIVTSRDFEGTEFTYSNGLTGESDGQQKSASLLLGGSFGEGLGRAVLSIDWAERDGVEFANRPLGQQALPIPPCFGICFPTPPAPPPNCEGPNVSVTFGSGTTVPTRITIPGAGTVRQFRNDRTLAGTCNVFNFFPYGYYQTPQERFGGAVVGRFTLTQGLEAYSRVSYGSTSVSQQIAPSGIFGDFLWTPMSNALIDPAVRTQIVNQAETNRTAGGSIDASNWRDEDFSGTVTPADDLLVRYFRRTVELGPRETQFDNRNFQVVVGGRAELSEAWSLDLSYATGRAERTQIWSGYTDLSNIAQQVDSEDGLNCAPGASVGCVPLDLFGGFGTITEAAADYADTGALVSESYEQDVITGVLNGALPAGGRAVALRLGYETRRESGDFRPDLCLTTGPTSCLGGADDMLQAAAGKYRVNEFFGEARIPMIDRRAFAEALDLELGVRRADFSSSGTGTSWKAGLAWTVTEVLQLRAMNERSVRAPSIAEFAAPRSVGTDFAQQDPCSVANVAFLNSGTQLAAATRSACEVTGMTPAQVGTVPDVVSGEVGAFAGADPDNPPDLEEGDARTFGITLTPVPIAPFRNLYLTFDYYDITVHGPVGAYSAQQVLDACYTEFRAAQCASIVRVNGDLVQPGSGVELFNTNLGYRQVRGLELGAGLGVEGAAGRLGFSALVNKNLAQRTDAGPAAASYDCVGRYSPECGGPSPELRWVQRTTWDVNRLQASLQWRHLDGTTGPVQQIGFGTFTQGSIPAYDYFDLSLGYKALPNVRLNASLNNLFDKDPPVVGDGVGPAGTNAGNTFASRYDPVGRVYVFGIHATF